MSKLGLRTSNRLSTIRSSQWLLIAHQTSFILLIQMFLHSNSRSSWARLNCSKTKVREQLWGRCPICSEINLRIRSQCSSLKIRIIKAATYSASWTRHSSLHKWLLALCQSTILSPDRRGIRQSDRVLISQSHLMSSQSEARLLVAQTGSTRRL